MTSNEPQHARREEVADSRIERNFAEAQRLAHIGTWEWEMQGWDVFWSDECFRIWGYEPNAVEPSFELFLAGVHVEDRAAVHTATWAAVEARSSHDMEYRVVGADGQLRHVHGRGHVTLDAQGNPERVIGYVQDVTQQKLTEEALRVAMQRAEEASRVKSDLLSRASHELRTPLNSILGYAQLLELEVEKPHNRESVQHILRSGMKLLKMVNELLDLSHAASDQSVLNLQPVRIASVVETVFALSRASARQRNVVLEASVPTDCACYVVADSERLEQALLNLLGNAIQYAEGGNVSVHCPLSGENSVRISVQDSGPGIDASALEHIFDPFNRAGAERTGEDGTGLGLAHTRALVEAMGGQVGAVSTTGRGSTFWIELPLAAESTCEGT